MNYKVPAHIAGVWNGSEIRLFVDGVLHREPTSCQAPPPRGAVATLGAAADRTQPYTGRLLQVRFSTSTRYEQDFDPASILETDGDAAALYRFDRETGETVPDLSGNNKTATLRGATWTTAPRIPKTSVVTPAAANRARAAWVVSRGG